MRTNGIRWAGVVLAMATAACGGDRMPAAPSAPTPQPRTLAGVWAGAVGLSSEDGRSLGLIWSAERNGEGRLSGTATLSTLPSASVQITFVGTMTSVRSGDQFVLTYTSDPRSVNGAPCTASAAGSAHLEEFTLVGDLDVRYQSCDGVGLQPPASTHLQLLMKLD
jgi:hypothetical protein